MLVALLPACVLAILMLGYFTSARLSEIEQVHIERGRAFARQLAVASEFGVFSANREILQLLTNAALQEADVRVSPSPTAKATSWRQAVRFRQRI